MRWDRQKTSSFYIRTMSRWQLIYVRERMYQGARYFWTPLMLSAFTSVPFCLYIYIYRILNYTDTPILHLSCYFQNKQRLFLLLRGSVFSLGVNSYSNRRICLERIVEWLAMSIYDEYPVFRRLHPPPSSRSDEQTIRRWKRLHWIQSPSTFQTF